jgi:hypothetical protein
MSGPRLGVKPKSSEVCKKRRKEEKKDVGIRNWVESKFEQCKRRFGLNKIMGKLPNTSETMISLCFLVANLSKVCCVLSFKLSQKLNLRKLGPKSSIIWVEMSNINKYFGQRAKPQPINANPFLLKNSRMSFS